MPDQAVKRLEDCPIEGCEEKLAYAPHHGGAACSAGHQFTEWGACGGLQRTFTHEPGTPAHEWPRPQDFAHVPLDELSRLLDMSAKTYNALVWMDSDPARGQRRMLEIAKELGLDGQAQAMIRRGWGMGTHGS